MEADSFSDLYSVPENDYALSALENIFGGIINFIAGRDEAYNEVGTFLSPLIGMMNMVVLGLAVIVGTYTLFSLTADTAADGQVLGRSTDTKNTFLRMGLAGLAFLPVSGGFSVIQLLAFGVAIGGSGMANQSWNWFSSSYLDGGAYASMASMSSEGSWQMRGKMADATYTMVMGKLCQLHLDRLADTYNVDAGTTAVASPSTTRVESGWIWAETTETRTYEWHYRTGGGADASNDICGSVKYSISYQVPSEGGSSAVNSFTENLSALAKEQVFNSVVTTMRTIVRPRADALAMRIYSGNPGDTAAALRNDAVVQAEIKAIAEQAAASIFNSRSSVSADNETFDQLQQELMETVTSSGWIMAPIWQRGMATLHVSIRDLQTKLDLSVSPEHTIGKIFGEGTWGWWGADNEVSRASFAPVERDFEYLESQVAFLTKLGQPDTGSSTNTLGSDAGAEMGGQAMQALYSMFIGTLGATSEDGGFKDPFIVYTDIGANLFWVGTPMVAGSSVVEGVASTVGVDGLVSVFTGPIKAVGYFILALAVAYMLIIPTIPMLYFFSGIISWLALVLEAVFALPLALLMWLVPAREPSMIGPWNKVMVTLLGLLLRPIFIIVGLIAFVLLLWVGNEILAIFFLQMLAVMTPGWTVMAVVMMCGLIGLYCYASVLLALHCSSLINFFGDAVMNWIGGYFASPLSRDAVGENLASQARSGVPMPGIGGFNNGLNSAGKGAVQGHTKITEWQARRNQPRLGSGG